jgi:transposase
MDTGPCEVARLLGLSRTTERQYRAVLEAAGLLRGSAEELPALETLKAIVEAALPPKKAPQSTTSLERWVEHVRLLAGRGLRPRAIYDRLRLDHADFDGTYWAVKRLVKRLARERGVRPEDVAIPVETRPGEVVQVDFGEIGRLWDPMVGRLRRAWVFVMVLGHSRKMVARIVFDQKVETWIRLHIEAFAALGGIPEVIVPDNLKAAVVRAAFGVGGVSALNRSYRELARYYGFKVDPTPVRQPKKKGKVEAGVRYVKRNGLAGLAGADVDVACTQLARWVSEIANQRIHGTTQRRPAEVFEAEERAALRELPTVAYEPVIWHEAGRIGPMMRKIASGWAEGHCVPVEVWADREEQSVRRIAAITLGRWRPWTGVRPGASSPGVGGMLLPGIGQVVGEVELGRASRWSDGGSIGE